MFVHVVEKREDGIVIRGAKAHMTGMVNSHWMLIMPTMGMQENEAEYAVSCAIPVDAPGVTHIFGRQTNDDRKCEGTIDQGNANYGIVGGECLTVLDNVFVPWEYVFMCGEYQFSGLLVERFAAITAPTTAAARAVSATWSSALPHCGPTIRAPARQATSRTSSMR